MKASELRIGNLLQGNNCTHLIDGIRSTYYNSQCGSTLFRDAKPIPLTEEWLLKLGFDVDNRPEWINQLQKYEIICRGVHYLKGCENQTTPIQYVHQLQNLYFALTGEELTIK